MIAFLKHLNYLIKQLKLARNSAATAEELLTRAGAEQRVRDCGFLFWGNDPQA